MFPLGFHSQEVFIRPDYSIFSSEYEHIFNFFFISQRYYCGIIDSTARLVRIMLNA